MPQELKFSEERLFGALLVQPFLAAATAFAVFPIFLLDSSGGSLAGGYLFDVNDAARSVAFGVAIVAAAVTFLGVAPTAIWLMKRRQLTLFETLLCGIGFGALPFMMVSVGAGATNGGPPGALRGLAFSIVIGLVCAAAFWLIAVKPRAE